MPNPYYTHSGYPGNRSAGSSAALRAELAAIMQGFDRLPELAGMAGRLVGVNTAGTAMETLTVESLHAKLIAVTGGQALWHAGNFNPASKLDASATAVAAAKLATPRSINGVAFDGTQDINISAGAGTFLPLSGGNLTGGLSGPSGNFSALGVGGNGVWHAGNFNPGAKADTSALASYLPLSGGTLGGLLQANGGIQTTGAGLSLAAGIGDAVNGSPWYGIGRNSSDLFGAGGNTVQVAGYYGLRLRTQGVVLDMRPWQIDLNQPFFSNSLIQTSDFMRAAQLTATNGWFRNVGVNTGLYNEQSAAHWYSEDGQGYTTAGPGGQTSGSLRMRAGFGGAFKGALYWDGSGIGLLNDQATWSVQCGQGAARGGTLHGNWGVSSGSSFGATTIFTDHISAVRDGAAHDPYGPIAVTRGTAASYAYFGLTRVGQIGMALGIDTSNRFVIGQSSSGSAASMINTALALTMGGTLTIGDALVAQRIVARADSGQAGSVNSDNWFRSFGNSGWFSQDYGGGIWMTDGTWVRTYAGKGFLIQSGIAAYGMLNLVGQGSGAQEVSMNFRDGNQTQDQGWTVGRYSDSFFFYSNGAQRLRLDNNKSMVANGRVFGNGGDGVAAQGNGLGRITVSASGPSGGAQGDIWCVY